jgi:hypothetical protein
MLSNFVGISKNGMPILTNFHVSKQTIFEKKMEKKNVHQVFMLGKVHGLHLPYT